MAKIEIPLTKRADSGIYQANIAGQRISLGTRNRAEAEQKIKEAKLDQVAALAKAGALTHRAVEAVIGAEQTIKELVSQWQEVRIANGRSQFTVFQDIARIERFCLVTKSADKTPREIDERIVSSHINGGEPRTASTRDRELNSLRSFFEFCVYRGVCQNNPAANVDVNLRLLPHEHKEKGETEPITEHEYKLLMTSGELEGSWFAYAVPVAWATGLRIGDVACLERACVQRDGLVVHTSKGLSRVVLPFDDKITPGLKEVLRSIPHTDDRYFFPEEREVAMDPAKKSKHSVYFGRHLKRVGIENKSFHSLRASCARRWRALGFSLDACREYLGHAAESTTAGYTGERHR